jgi:predicted transcriptional regulator
MMANYRNRLDIIADILGVVSQGAKKTQVMYEANLSYRLLTKYLAEVLSFGFIYFEATQKRYQLTHKGRSFLKTYQEYSRRNKHVEKQLNNIHEKRKVLDGLCSGG